LKIAAKDIEKFILNVPSNIRAILLYGPDAGLVSIRATTLKKSRSIAAIFDYEQIKNNPGSLLDNFNSLNLFSKDKLKEKIILIECNGKHITESCINLLKSPNYQGLLVFHAKELGTDSNLRKTFEANNNIAAVPCYQDDQASINKIIQQALQQQKISCDHKVIALLTNCISTGNRALILNEIDKIILFLSNKKHISVEDIQDYLELQNEVNFDKLCYQISLKQTKNIDITLVKLQNEGHNIVSIIRMITRHFYRLYQVKQLIKQNKTEQQALSTLYPPVFFKQVNDFSRSLKLWDITELKAFLKELNHAELAAKENSISSELILKNIILNLSL
jgi:DNA polymerase III subunit delta